MKFLDIEPLNADSFKPYGNIIETAGASSVLINSGNCKRFNDLAGLDIDDSGRAGISLFEAKPYASPYQLNYVERHPLGSQAFVPMTSEKYLVIVADDIDGVAQEPKVFMTNGFQGVNYARNVWHGVLSPIVTTGLFAVVDYIGNVPNLEEFEFKTEEFEFKTPFLIRF